MDTIIATAIAPAVPSVSTPAVPSVSTETHLEYLAKNTQSCILRPYCFFVSWQGVLTLAYRGFPPSLVALKQQISDYHQGLPKESPGSKWPKTSLASLKEGKRLTPAQLQRLNELCREQSGIFQAPGAARTQAVLVNNLSTIVYETRCLERVVSRQVMQLAQPTDMSDAAAEEIERVQAVVAEADHEDYWFHASRDGNREKHYRSPALGVTLVHELSCFKQPQSSLQAGRNSSSSTNSADAGADEPAAAAATAVVAAAPALPSSLVSSLIGNSLIGGGSGSSTPTAAGSAWSAALPGIIGKFRAAVEEEVPGLFAWFEEASLHVTIRAIIV